MSRAAFLTGLPRKVNLGRGSFWLPNRTGLNRFAESVLFQEALKRRARLILQAYNPRMIQAGESDWTFVERDPNLPSVRVGTRFPFAHLDEWGSINNAPYGSMRRAAIRAGFRFRPTPKGGG